LPIASLVSLFSLMILLLIMGPFFPFDRISLFSCLFLFFVLLPFISPLPYALLSFCPFVFL
jgi:hypothetical protein